MTELRKRGASGCRLRYSFEMPDESQGGGQAKRSSLGAIWRRLRGRHPPERTMADLERAQLELLRAAERADALAEEQARALLQRPVPAGPALADRFDAIHARAERELSAIRRARPARSPRGVDDETLHREALGHVEKLEVDILAADGERDVEEHNAAEWERRAALAVRAGDDPLAKEALARRREHLALAAVLRRDLDRARAVVAEIRAALSASRNEPAE